MRSPTNPSSAGKRQGCGCDLPVLQRTWETFLDGACRDVGTPPGRCPASRLPVPGREHCKVHEADTARPLHSTFFPFPHDFLQQRGCIFDSTGEQFSVCPEDINYTSRRICVWEIGASEPQRTPSAPLRELQPSRDLPVAFHFLYYRQTTVQGFLCSFSFSINKTVLIQSRRKNHYLGKNQRAVTEQAISLTPSPAESGNCTSHVAVYKPP